MGPGLPSEPRVSCIPLCSGSLPRYSATAVLSLPVTQELFNEKTLVSQLGFFPVRLVVRLQVLSHCWGRMWPLSC